MTEPEMDIADFTKSINVGSLPNISVVQDIVQSFEISHLIQELCAKQGTPCIAPPQKKIPPPKKKVPSKFLLLSK